MKIKKSKARETFIAISKLGPMPSKVAYALSMNKTRLRPIIEAIDEQVKALVLEHLGNETSLPNDDPRLVVFNKATAAFLEEVEDFDPYRFNGKPLETIETGDCDPNALESIFWLQKEPLENKDVSNETDNN